MNLRHRRPVSEPDQVVVDDVAEPVAVPEESDESPAVRALRAQVRSLEQALEVAPDRPAAVDPSYRNQVLLAIRAVASRAGDSDDARHAAARVVAAVERLDGEGFTRPVLPGIASRTVPAPPPPLPSAEPAVIAPTPAAPVLTARPDADRTPEPEVVLPVPPPAPEEPPRRRRLRRHHATTAA